MIIFIVYLWILTVKGMSQGSCTFIGDKLYYLGGVETGNNLDNKQIFELNLNDLTSLKERNPWNVLDFNLTKYQGFRYGNLMDMKDNRIGVIGGRMFKLGNSFSLIDLDEKQVTSPKPSKDAPFLTHEFITFPYSWSSLVKQDDDNYLHYGGDAYVTYEYTHNFKVRRFNVKTMEWTILPGDGPIGSSLVAGYLDRQLFVFGGWHKKKDLSMSEIWIYNIDTNEWTTKTATGTVPSPRHHPTTVQGDNFIYLTGGQIDYKMNDDVNTIYSLDLTTLVWSEHKVFLFDSSTADGCLAYYKGILISSFGYFHSFVRPTYMVHTNNYTNFDYKSLANGGISVASALTTQDDLTKDSINNSDNKLKGTPDTEPSTNPATQPNSDPPSKSHQYTTTFILIISVSSLVGLCLILSLLFCLYKRFTKKAIPPPEPTLEPVWSDPNLAATTVTTPQYAHTQDPSFDPAITHNQLLGHNLQSFKSL